MQRVRFLDYQEQEILFFDFSELQAEQEIEAAIAAAKKRVIQQEPASLLTLTDVSGMIRNAQTARTLWELLKHNKPYVRAAAAVGVDTDKELDLYHLITHQSRRKIALFGDTESAMAWLVRQMP